MSRFANAGPCPVQLHWDAGRDRLVRMLYVWVARLARYLPWRGLMQLLDAIPDSNEDFACP